MLKMRIFWKKNCKNRFFFGGVSGAPTPPFACTNVSPPQRGGAFPAPLSERWAEMARQLPRGARPSGRPLQSSGIIVSIFSCSRPLTSRSWTATLLFFYDWTLIYSPPLTRLLILLLLFASGNVHPNPGPVPVRLTKPIYPCSVCSREIGRTSVQCSHSKRWVHSTYSGLPGPTLRFMFSRSDVGGCICPPCSADPHHQAPTIVMNHPSTVTTISPHLTPISPTVTSTTVTTTPTVTP